MSVKGRAEIELNSIDDKASQTDLEVVDAKADNALETAEDAQSLADIANTNISDLDLFINGGYAIETQSAYDGLTCQKTAFYEKVSGVYGTYVFTYNGSSWTLNGAEVDIEEYAIKFEDTPAANDTITITLTEVVGSVTNINNQVEALDSKIDSNADTAASELQSAQTSLQMAINAATQAINAAQSELDIVSTKTAGMGFTNEYGLVLYGQGATDNTGFKLQLAAQAINFINGALNNSQDILAYISGNSLNINNAIVRKQLAFGNFAFIPRVNGNMSLKYLG